jgi:hypothetical protein
MSDNADAINTAASEPKTVNTDGLTVSAHSLPDRIAADKYAAANDQAVQKNRGISFAQFRHQGGVH